MLPGRRLECLMKLRRILIICCIATMPLAGWTRSVQKLGKGVPKFEVDPTWPKTRPENWAWREQDVLGVYADVRDDHVWVTTRGEVAEFNADGKLVQVWNAQ